MNFITNDLTYPVNVTEENVIKFFGAMNKPEIVAYPYPYLNAVRELGDGIHKVLNNMNIELYLITRYEDINEMLRHPYVERIDRAPKEIRDTLLEKNPIDLIRQNGLLFFRDPDHKLLRGLINKAFTPRMVAGMEVAISELCDNLLNKIEGKDELELVTDFSFPLPVLVIMRLLGVPDEDIQKVREWTMKTVKPFTGLVVTNEEIPDIFRNIREIRAYFLSLCDRKRQNPKDDLITELLKAEIDGEKLSDDELFGTCVLLLVAGHETTTNAIGMAMFHLLRNPNLIEYLDHNPDKLDLAIEEFLRFEAGFLYAAREIHENFEYKGVQFQKGNAVLMVYGAGNRDPNAFSDPNNLVLDRQEEKHLSFGKGAHYCLGAPLARLELKIAIPKLLKFLKNYEPDGENIKFKVSGLIRGIEQFPFRKKNEL